MSFLIVPCTLNPARNELISSLAIAYGLGIEIYAEVELQGTRLGKKLGSSKTVITFIYNFMEIKSCNANSSMCLR
jgi:hypothetical protein